MIKKNPSSSNNLFGEMNIFHQPGFPWKEGFRVLKYLLSIFLWCQAVWRHYSLGSPYSSITLRQSMWKPWNNRTFSTSSSYILPFPIHLAMFHNSIACLINISAFNFTKKPCCSQANSSKMAPPVSSRKWWTKRCNSTSEATNRQKSTIHQGCSGRSGDRTPTIL